MHLSSKNLAIASISMLWIRSTIKEIKNVIVGTGEAVKETTLLSRRQFQSGFFHRSSMACEGENSRGMVTAQNDILSTIRFADAGRLQWVSPLFVNAVHVRIPERSSV